MALKHFLNHFFKLRCTLKPITGSSTLTWDFHASIHLEAAYWINITCKKLEGYQLFNYICKILVLNSVITFWSHFSFLLHCNMKNCYILLITPGFRLNMSIWMMKKDNYSRGLRWQKLKSTLCTCFTIFFVFVLCHYGHNQAPNCYLRGILGISWNPASQLKTFHVHTF